MTPTQADFRDNSLENSSKQFHAGKTELHNPGSFYASLEIEVCSRLLFCGKFSIALAQTENSQLKFFDFSVLLRTRSLKQSLAFRFPFDVLPGQENLALRLGETSNGRQLLVENWLLSLDNYLCREDIN